MENKQRSVARVVGHPSSKQNTTIDTCIGFLSWINGAEVKLVNISQMF